MKLSTMKLALPPPSDPSTRSGGPAPTPASPAPVTNPLWVITAALALFFAVAAAFLAAG
jgi:hypothetical protein